MQTSIRIADYLEAHCEDLHQRILEGLPPKFANPLALFLKPWILDQASSLRQEANRFNEWVVKHADAVRDAGGEIEDMLAQIRHIRDCFLKLCGNNIDQVSEKDIHEAANLLFDRHMGYLGQYYNQLERLRAGAERRRQRAIVEAIEAAFVLLDANGRITLCNAHFAEAVGGVAEQMERTPVERVCDDAAVTEIRRALKQKRNTGMRSFKGHVLRPSGKRVAASFQVQPMYDAQGRRDGVALNIDFGVKERTQIKDYLRYVGEKIIPLMPNAVQLCDDQKTVLYSNEAARMVSLPLNDPALPFCCRLTQASGSTEPCPCERVLKTGTTWASEQRYEFSDDAPWYRLVIIPFSDSAGDVIQLACSIRDLSQQRSLEHSLENQLLYQQRTSLASQVAVTVSHQLRNPLGVMIGFAEMLQRGLAPDQTPDAIDKILRNGLRCKQIVDDLLEFGQGFPAERIPTELTALMREVVTPMIPASQLQRIEWRLPPEAGPIESVPSQLAQVFVNLIENALQAARSRVLVEISQEKEWVLVRVEDDGPGVANEVKDRLFEPFVTTRKEEGAVGLGLSLSLAVVRDYGGMLSLEQEAPGEKAGGAVFTVQLPILRAHAGGEGESAIEQDAPGRGERLLVVDDETDLLDMLDMVLELRGYTVHTATTAAEALELLEKHHYEAIVLDVLLPGDMNGPQLYEYLQAKDPALARRAMFITADTMNYETRKFLDKVRRPSMEKPFLVFDFVSMVNEVLHPVE